MRFLKLLYRNPLVVAQFFLFVGALYWMNQIDDPRIIYVAILYVCGYTCIVIENFFYDRRIMKKIDTATEALYALLKREFEREDNAQKNQAQKIPEEK